MPLLPFCLSMKIHRFSKSQQDSLLNAVETGTVTLIGATTETFFRKLFVRCFLVVRFMF